VNNKNNRGGEDTHHLSSDSRGANLSQVLRHSALALNALVSGTTLTQSFFIELPKDLPVSGSRALPLQH
jgi:hypothetical protein